MAKYLGELHWLIHSRKMADLKENETCGFCHIIVCCIMGIITAADWVLLMKISHVTKQAW